MTDEQRLLLWLGEMPLCFDDFFQKNPVDEAAFMARCVSNKLQAMATARRKALLAGNTQEEDGNEHSRYDYS